MIRQHFFIIRALGMKFFLELLIHFNVLFAVFYHFMLTTRMTILMNIFCMTSPKVWRITISADNFHISHALFVHFLLYYSRWPTFLRHTFIHPRCHNHKVDRKTKGSTLFRGTKQRLCNLQLSPLALVKNFSSNFNVCTNYKYPIYLLNASSYMHS